MISVLNRQHFAENTTGDYAVMNVTVLDFENCTFVIYLKLFEHL